MNRTAKRVVLPHEDVEQFMMYFYEKVPKEMTDQTFMGPGLKDRFMIVRTNREEWDEIRNDLDLVKRNRFWHIRTRKRKKK